jgi:hypothetical protein
MAATARMIELLRRMTAEPTADTYHDAELAKYIETYPVLDSEGHSLDSEDWDPSYDLQAAAADIWEEKAALFAEEFTFRADGAAYNLAERYQQIMGRVRWHRARRTPKSARLYKYPEELDTGSWIINLPETP